MNNRNEQKLQTSLNEKTWSNLNKVITQHQQNHSLSKPFTVHCHIPLCIGYNDDDMNDKLMAMVNSIESKGYNYTFYLAPRGKLIEETKSPLETWKQKHARFLSLIPLENVILESAWRKEPAWKEAKAAYEAYRNGDKNEAVSNLLKSDVNKYARSHKSIAKDVITEHMIDCVVDCLSWMEKKDIEKSQLKKMNVFLYPNSRTQVMHNALQNADEIGYVKGSLIQLKPFYEERFENKQAAVPVKPEKIQQPTISDSSSNDVVRFIASCTTDALSKNLNPEIVAKFAIALYREAEQRQLKDHRSSLVPNSLFSAGKKGELPQPSCSNNNHTAYNTRPASPAATRH